MESRSFCRPRVAVMKLRYHIPCPRPVDYIHTEDAFTIKCTTSGGMPLHGVRQKSQKLSIILR